MRIVLLPFLVAVVGPAIAHASDPLLDLQVGGAIVAAEYARSPAERERGLMERTEMAADHGMLFRFDDFRRHCLWMKNTKCRRMGYTGRQSMLRRFSQRNTRIDTV